MDFLPQGKSWLWDVSDMPIGQIYVQQEYPVKEKNK